MTRPTSRVACLFASGVLLLSPRCSPGNNRAAGNGAASRPDSGAGQTIAPEPESGEFVQPASRSAILDPEYAERLAKITEHPQVRAALQTIVEIDDQTMADMVSLTEIEAPPFKEERRAIYYADMLRAEGLSDVHIDEVGNVVGTRPGAGGGRTLAFTAHLDTVFPPGTDVRVRRDGTRYLAPGIGDDARGLVTLVAVVRALNAHAIETADDILIIGTVGEEGLGDLRGVKHLFSEAGPDIDAFITVDGTGSQGVTHDGLGSNRYRVTFRGPGGHSWGAFGLANPHHALGAAIKYFVDAADEYTRDSEDSANSTQSAESAQSVKTSYNVGRISGGTSVNSIPFESSMEVDMRSESVERLEGIDALLQKAVSRALDEQNAIKRSGPELEVEVERIGKRPSGEIDPMTPLVQWAFAATAYLDQQPVPGRGSTDANVPIARGIPAIAIGGGGLAGGYHALDEWYDNQGGPRGIQRALLVVLGQAGFTSP